MRREFRGREKQGDIEKRGTDDRGGRRKKQDEIQRAE